MGYYKAVLETGAALGSFSLWVFKKWGKQLATDPAKNV